MGTDGFGLLLHEVLHGLGLKHPHDDGGTGRPTYQSSGFQFIDRQWITVMSYDEIKNGGDLMYSGSQPIGPMIMDAIGLQYLYGESKFNEGDSTYDLRNYLGNYYNCQWDYSGEDILNGSGLNYGIVVDLGIFSADNGTTTHNAGYITSVLDSLLIETIGVNPDKWTWLWGEYENVNGTSYYDIINGNDLNNKLNGGLGDDELIGGDGDDTFDWDSDLRGGDDTMVGGLGDDVYVINTSGDNIEEELNEGTDTVWAAIDYSLPDNVEKLNQFGLNDAAATGNILSNYISGNTKNNSINGGDGNDTLVGGDGNDTFDWDSDLRAGDDSMFGGIGNDVYVVNTSGDNIIEKFGEGTDTVWVTIDYTLPDNVEILKQFGSLNVSATGNGSSNYIYGNIGNNVISGGGGGVDTVDGSDGQDTLSLSGNRNAYIVIKSETSESISIIDSDEKIIFKNVESFSFADALISYANLFNQSPAAISATNTTNEDTAKTGTLAGTDVEGT